MMGLELDRILNIGTYYKVFGLVVTYVEVAKTATSFLV